MLFSLISYRNSTMNFNQFVILFMSVRMLFLLVLPRLFIHFHKRHCCRTKDIAWNAVWKHVGSEFPTHWWNTNGNLAPVSRCTGFTGIVSPDEFLMTNILFFVNESVAYRFQGSNSGGTHQKNAVGRDMINITLFQLC